MSARQVAFVVLVALICLVRSSTDRANAQGGLGKCNAGCWNMTADDWVLKQLTDTVCYSYSNGPTGNNIYAPAARAGTTKAVGGNYTDQSELIQQYRSTLPCTATCVGVAPIEAKPTDATKFKLFGQVERFACGTS